LNFTKIVKKSHCASPLGWGRVRIEHTYCHVVYEWALNPIHWICIRHKKENPQFLKNIFLVCPIWLPVFSYFFYNEPELGVGIDPGMALTPLPSSIGQGSNPRPSDCEPSALPQDHSFSLSTPSLLTRKWRRFPHRWRRRLD
jgi:hypothetical protein